MDSAIIFLFASVIIIGIGLIVIITLTKKAPRTLDQKKYQQQWLTIEQSVTDEKNSMQFAIVQADKLLDKALKERGFKGETMGERMKSAQKVFSRTDMLWAAHKLRNRIVHEDSIVIDKRQTMQGLRCFKLALKDIGAL